jgi:nitrite reductase (NADH) small subunit
MSEEGKGNSEAFPSKETEDRHSPGVEGAAKREPESDMSDKAASAREPEAHEVGDLSDFPEGSHKVVKVGGREMGIFNIKGEFYALPNICAHQTGPLCEAKFLTGTMIANEETNWNWEWIHDGEIVICPWHGLEYHVPTGQCIAFKSIQLRNYEVIVEDNKVKVRV